MSSLIKDLLKQNLKDSNTKGKHFINGVPETSSVSKEALRAYCHLLELFVREGALRAQNQAKEDDNSQTIEFEHLEQIFVQLLLDF